MTFQHRAGVSPYTSPFGFAETCVFDKQSPGPFHCGLLSQAPLLPKLRGQYAEFLNNPSPVGLRILSSSTCVGLRYGRSRCTVCLFSPPAPAASLLFFSPFRPGLPAYPGRTNLPLETLDFRPLRFSRNSRYSFRHSHFSSVHLSFRSDFTPMRTLPYPVIDCLSFGYMLSPVKSSAQHHSTSELLRTL